MTEKSTRSWSLSHVFLRFAERKGHEDLDLGIFALLHGLEITLKCSCFWTMGFTGCNRINLKRKELQIRNWFPELEGDAVYSNDVAVDKEKEEAR